MNMVRVNLPRLDNVCRDECQRFFDEHLPAVIPFRVVYLQDGDVELIIPESKAASAMTLYYSIPDWLKCAS